MDVITRGLPSSFSAPESGGKGPGDNFQQCRFAGAVGADKPNHFALHNIQIHARQSLHHAEALAYSPDGVDDRRS
jgi:hypothetical protein